MPRQQKFAMTLRAWATDAKKQKAAVRGEAAGILAEALTVGNRFGPGTPVKTGRLLSGWTVESRDGQRLSVGTQGPKGDVRDRPDQQRARVPRWIQRVRVMARLRDVRIFTEVPYAQYVDEGHPTKRQFITKVRNNWGAIVRLAQRRVKMTGRIDT